jgi:hypothetical protein
MGDGFTGLNIEAVKGELNSFKEWMNTISINYTKI